MVNWAIVLERKAFAKPLKLILQLVQEILQYCIFQYRGVMKCSKHGRLRLNCGFNCQIRAWCFQSDNRRRHQGGSVSTRLLGPNQLGGDKPRVETVGGKGKVSLANALVDSVDKHQRCHWHLSWDLYHMMYQNGARKADNAPWQGALAGALAIE